MIDLYKADALEMMDNLIKKGIKVDMVLTDPPYGILNKKTYGWDDVIDFKEMWSRLDKLTHDNTPIILFGRQPFTSYLNLSNIENFRYEIIWEKEKGIDFLHANKKPLNNHENISVFYKKLPYYNPQKDDGKPYTRLPYEYKTTSTLYENKLSKPMVHNNGERHPKTVRKYNTPTRNERFHPTQKPVDMLEWLIKSYSKQGDTILDFTMGSGSTGVACKNTNRNFIGIERDPEYYDIAKKRMDGEVK